MGQRWINIITGPRSLNSTKYRSEANSKEKPKLSVPLRLRCLQLNIPKKEREWQSKARCLVKIPTPELYHKCQEV